MLWMTWLISMGVWLGCDGGGDAPQSSPPPAVDPTAAEPANASADAGSDNADAGSDGDAEGGRWRRARPAQDTVTEQLDALGYMDGYEQAPTVNGIIRHDQNRVSAGYNFYFSGHGTEAVLMSMDGTVMHSWSLPFATSFPDEAPTPDRQDNTQSYWRRGHLLENGAILAIHSHYGVVRVNRNSELVWAVKNGAHHHMDIAEDGNIYVLTRKRDVFEEIGTQRLWGDAVDVLSVDGQEIRSVSILQALLDSEFTAVKERLGTTGSLLHTNSLQVLDGRMASLIPAFKKGNILLSFRTLDLLAVLDMETEQIVWVKEGPWLKQHDAFVLDEDSMIVFNNNRGNRYSSVLIFNPQTDQIEWTFEGSRDEPFYSSSCGANQLLPNGNVLATESNYGRALEITPDGDVVWEFVSPHRAGADNELIATLFEVERLPASTDVSWASAP